MLDGTCVLDEAAVLLQGKLGFLYPCKGGASDGGATIENARVPDDALRTMT